MTLTNDQLFSRTKPKSTSGPIYEMIKACYDMQVELIRFWKIGLLDQDLLKQYYTAINHILAEKVKFEHVLEYLNYTYSPQHQINAKKIAKATKIERAIDNNILHMINHDNFTTLMNSFNNEARNYFVV